MYQCTIWMDKDSVLSSSFWNQYIRKHSRWLQAIKRFCRRMNILLPVEHSIYRVSGLFESMQFWQTRVFLARTGDYLTAESKDYLDSLENQLPAFLKEFFSSHSSANILSSSQSTKTSQCDNWWSTQGSISRTMNRYKRTKLIAS